jgi:hypothetical protein
MKSSKPTAVSTEDRYAAKYTRLALEAFNERPIKPPRPPLGMVASLAILALVTLGSAIASFFV